MNVLTPAAVIVEAHHILKALIEGSLQAANEHTQAALGWLEERQMVEALLDEVGNMQYEVTRWGRVALLGRQAA